MEEIILLSQTLFVVLLVFLFLGNILLTISWLIWSFLRRRKVFKIISRLPKAKKLLVYAKENKIKIETGPMTILLVINGGGWGALPQKKAVLIAKESLENACEEEIIYSFAHELGHLDYSSEISPNERKIKDCQDYFVCIYQEWEAWIRALKILKKLEIEINPRNFWQEAKYCLSTYYTPTTCPMFFRNECPMIEKIKEIEGTLKNELGVI